MTGSRGSVARRHAARLTNAPTRNGTESWRSTRDVAAPRPPGEPGSVPGAAGCYRARGVACTGDRALRVSAAAAALRQPQAATASRWSPVVVPPDALGVVPPLSCEASGASLPTGLQPRSACHPLLDKHRGEEG